MSLFEIATEVRVYKMPQGDFAASCLGEINDGFATPQRALNWVCQNLLDYILAEGEGKRAAYVSWYTDFMTASLAEFLRDASEEESAYFIHQLKRALKETAVTQDQERPASSLKTVVLEVSE